MNERAGSKTYAVAVGKAMVNMGHTITFVTRTVDGPMCKLAEKVGEIILYQDLMSLTSMFDLGFVSPNICATVGVRMLCRKLVSISHGKIEDEMPTNFSDSFVFVSDEVKEHWINKLDFIGKTSPVILNPIDRGFWKATPTSHKFTTVTRVSNYAEIPWLEPAIEAMGLNYINCKHQDPSEVRDSIEKSQLVIATGRSCYEAMSCGREVLVLDNREYNTEFLGYSIASDGLVSENYMEARKTNCSGRYSQQEATESYFRGVIESLRKDPMNLMFGGALAYDYAKNHHDVKTIAQRLLDVGGCGKW